MAWLFALGALALFVWLLAKFRGFRRGVVAFLLLAIAGGGAWYLYDQQEKQRLRTLITASQLEFRDIRMDNSGYARSVTGALKNNNPIHTLAAVKLTYFAMDCTRSEPSAPERCEVIGQETQTEYVHVPPGQVREFRGRVYFANMPPVRGRMVWDYDVVEVRAAK
jgi:hypothetical protein